MNYPMNKPEEKSIESSGVYTEPVDFDFSQPDNVIPTRASISTEEMLTGNRKTRRKFMAIVKRISKKNRSK